MFCKRRLRRVQAVSSAKLLEMLAVEDDHPVFAGVMAVLRGLEEEAMIATDCKEQPMNETKFLAGCGSGLREAQNRLDEIRSTAMKRKAGVK